MTRRPPPVLVELTRGETVEARHRGDIAVVDAAGVLLARCGEPTWPTYWRSSAKPFQSMPLVYTGAAQRFGLDAADLALCSASHRGEAMHTERVRSILARIGATPADLSCGTHLPYDRATAEALLARGERARNEHNNCSGKHAGMLVLARQLGAPLEGYSEPDHPVQREIAANVARFVGRPLEAAVDGCGVPAFALTVEEMARAFARLMTPEGVGEPYADAARQIAAAMRAHPELVAGSVHLDTDLMRTAAGGLVAKGGASGVMCVGLADGRGVALKIEDGGIEPPYARGVAIIEALRQVGGLGDDALDALAIYARPALRNVARRQVGEARPAFTLEQLAGATAR